MKHKIAIRNIAVLVLPLAQHQLCRRCDAQIGSRGQNQARRHGQKHLLLPPQMKQSRSRPDHNAEKVLCKE